MKCAWQPLRRSEINHELLWLTVSTGSLGMAALWFTFGLPWPHCVFHDLTGLPCLTCGATRSTIAFLHGHLLGASRWNPLVFTSLCAISIFNVYALVVLIARAPRLRIADLSGREKYFARLTPPILLAANWIYLLNHWRSY